MPHRGLPLFFWAMLRLLKAIIGNFVARLRLLANVHSLVFEIAAFFRVSEFAAGDVFRLAIGA
jgi:hypothetical protein